MILNWLILTDTQILHHASYGPAVGEDSQRRAKGDENQGGVAALLQGSAFPSPTAPARRLARERAALPRPSSRFAAPALELGERHNPRLRQRRQSIPFDATGRAEECIIRGHEHCAASKNVGVEEPRGSQVRVLH